MLLSLWLVFVFTEMNCICYKYNGKWKKMHNYDTFFNVQIKKKRSVFKVERKKMLFIKLQHPRRGKQLYKYTHTYTYTHLYTLLSFSTANISNCCHHTNTRLLADWIRETLKVENSLKGVKNELVILYKEIDRERERERERLMLT